MIWKNLTVTTISFLLITQASWAEELCKKDSCEGKVKNEHNHDRYQFVTTSRVYKRDDAGVHVYETCVENHSEGWLEFNWHIPGPSSWVPPGKACSNPRRRISRDTLNGYAGCLRYGNDWENSRADFLPHKDDQDAIDREMQTDCKDVVQDEAEGTSDSRPSDEVLREPIEVALQIYAPWDRDRPIKTMMEVNASVSIVPVVFNDDAKIFQHIFEVKAEPANYDIEYDFQPELIRIVPQSETLRADYAKMANLKGGTFSLSGKQSPIKIERPFPKNPRLVSVRYTLFTEKGSPVAAFFVPFWVEAK